MDEFPTRRSIIASGDDWISRLHEQRRKPGEEKTVGEQTKQVSALMEKHYPMNEQGEILAEIPPELLASMKANLRSQAQLAAAADLEDLYDSQTGKLRDAAKLAEIQHAADQLASSISKGGAK